MSWVESAPCKPTTRRVSPTMSGYSFPWYDAQVDDVKPSGRHGLNAHKPQHQPWAPPRTPGTMLDVQQLLTPNSRAAGAADSGLGFEASFWPAHRWPRSVRHGSGPSGTAALPPRWPARPPPPPAAAAVPSCRWRAPATEMGWSLKLRGRGASWQSAGSRAAKPVSHASKALGVALSGDL